jgi:hypothetical protein
LKSKKTVSNEFIKNIQSERKKFSTQNPLIVCQKKLNKKQNLSRTIIHVPCKFQQDLAKKLLSALTSTASTVKVTEQIYIKFILYCILVNLVAGEEGVEVAT